MKARRVLAVIWQAYEDIKWLPLATAGILLMIINFPG